MKIFLKDAHNFSIKDSFEFLETDSSGLSVKEVSKRQEFFGPNLLPTQPPPTIFKIFIRQFLNPLIYILSFIFKVLLMLELALIQPEI